MCALKAVE